MLILTLESLVRSGVGDMDFDVEYDLCFALEKWMHTCIEDDLLAGYTGVNDNKRKHGDEGECADDYIDDDARFLKRRKVAAHHFHFIEKEMKTKLTS